MNRLSNNEKIQLLDDLFDLFLNSKYLTDEEVKSGEWDIDIEDIVSKNLMLLKRLKTQSKAELNKQRYERITKFIEKFRAGLADNLDEYKKFAENIFSNPKYSGLQPMFKNLENISEKDEKSILLDAKILEMLDELENDFGDQMEHGEN